MPAGELRLCHRLTLAPHLNLPTRIKVYITDTPPLPMVWDAFLGDNARYHPEHAAKLSGGAQRPACRSDVFFFSSCCVSLERRARVRALPRPDVRHAPGERIVALAQRFHLV